MVPSDAHELLFVAALPAERPDRVVIEVVGEVDNYTAPLLAACLQTQLGRRGIRELVVDMAGVSFLGGAGLSVLAGAQARCQGMGARLCVRCHGARPVWRPLQLTGLCWLLCVDDSAMDDRGAAAPRQREELSPWDASGAGQGWRSCAGVDRGAAR